jgi:hypothetical protein
MQFLSWTQLHVIRGLRCQFASTSESCKRLDEIFERGWVDDVRGEPFGQLRLLGRLSVARVEEDDGCPVVGVADRTTWRRNE